MPMRNIPRGYTLIELIVAVGLFALVMALAAGAYLLMININRQAQGISTGINNLSFALETMTRTIRTGTAYSCGLISGLGDCGSGGTSFTFSPAGGGAPVTYTLDGSTIQKKVGVSSSALTDPSSVQITSLMFYVSGTATASSGDYTQPHVTMVISGTVSAGPGKPTQSFIIETGATMRGSDL